MNIDLDDDLVASAMRLFQVSTKREAVDLALRRLVGEPLTIPQALAMEGTGWEADLDAVRGAGAPWS